MNANYAAVIRRGITDAKVMPLARTPEARLLQAIFLTPPEGLTRKERIAYEDAWIRTRR